MLATFPMPQQQMGKELGISPGLSAFETLNDQALRYNQTLLTMEGESQKLTRDQLVKALTSWISYLIEGIDIALTMILIPILANQMKTTLVYSSISLGTLIVGRMVGQCVLGSFLTKLGFKICSIFAIIIYTAGLVLTGLTKDIKLYLACRFIGGFGMGSFSLISSILLKCNLPPSNANWVSYNGIQFPLGYSLVGLLLLCGVDGKSIFYILSPFPVIFGIFLTIMWNQLSMNNLYLNRNNSIISIDMTYQPLPSIVPHPLAYLINHNLLRTVYCFLISFVWMSLFMCFFGLLPIFLINNLQLPSDTVQYIFIGVGLGGVLGALLINPLCKAIQGGKVMGMGAAGVVVGTVIISMFSSQWEFVVGASVWIGIMTVVGVSALHRHLADSLPYELYSVHSLVINFGLLLSPFIVPLVTYVSQKGPSKGSLLLGGSWSYFIWGFTGTLTALSLLQGFFLKRPAMNYPVSFPNSAIVTYNHVPNYSPQPPTAVVDQTPQINIESNSREIPTVESLEPPMEETLTATRRSSMRIPHPIYQPEKLNKLSPTWSVHSLPANLSYCEYLDPLLTSGLPPQQAQSTINLLSEQAPPPIEHSNNPFLIPPGAPMILIPSPTPMAYTLSHSSQFLHPSQIPLPISPHPMSISLSQSSQRTSYHPYMIPLPLSRVASECPSVAPVPVDPTQVPLPTSPILQASSVMGLLNSGWTGLGSFFVMKPAEPTTNVSTTRATPVVSMDSVMADVRPLSSIPKRVYENQ
jgi:MFS family permease